MDDLIKTIVLLLIIALLTTLTLYIFHAENQLNCDKCVFEYKTKRIYETGFNTITIKAMDLKNNLSEGTCLLKFSKTEGYYLNA
jgi:hypothetical protein